MILRNEDNPKQKIMKIGKFTEIQYESIVNMRLRNIAKLEEKKINDEYARLKERNKEINSILKSKSKLNKLISEQLDALSDEYSSDRKTTILDDVTSSKQIKKEIKISNEPMFVVLSTNGWIKSNKGSLENIDNLIFKSGDSFLDYLNIDNNKEVAFLIKRILIYNGCQ